MNEHDIDSLRHDWYQQVVSTLVPPAALDRTPGVKAMAPITRAAVTMLVGQGHLLGLNNEDLNFGEELRVDEVRQLIGFWRSGMVDRELVAEPMMATISLIWAAKRWEKWSESAAYASLHQSQLITRLEEVWGSGLLDARDYGSHLRLPAPADSDRLAWPDLLRAMATGEPGDLDFASPLEFCLIVDDPDRKWKLDRLEEVRRVTYAWLTAEGGWPESTGGIVPRWLRDIVTGDGARFWHNSTGFVPTFHLVLETDRDQSDFVKWTYKPSFSIKFLSDSEIVIYILLDPEGDPATLPFYFSYDDWQAGEQIDLFAIVELLRIEAYRLTASGAIEHIFNFGVSTDWMEPIFAHRARWAGKVNGPLGQRLEPRHLLQLIDQRQRAAFETTLPGLDPRGRASDVREAWERRLDVLDNAAATFSRGGLVDSAMLQESVVALRNAESRSAENHIDNYEAELEPGEALVHLAFREDLGWFSVVAVHRSIDGSYDGKFYDTTEGWSRGAAREDVDELLQPLVPLQQQGVKHLTLSAGAGAYTLPLHDSALRLGFDTVSYSHSVRRIPEETRATGALILGFAGDGPNLIPAVDRELKTVSSVYKTAISDAPGSWRGNWPGLVHVAGHGVTGLREFEAGIFLRDSFLSASAILRSVDASGTGLAFLSACDSGAGQFSIGAIGKSVPLDVALVERGCSTVISTCAPVNDVVASIFAVAFHAAFSAGASSWDAYVAARSVFAAGRKNVSSDLMDAFEEFLPNWQVELPREAEQTWRYFRFTGSRSSTVEK